MTMNVFRCVFFTLLLSMVLGCASKSEIPSIDNALNPMSAAPVNHFDNWKPRLTDAPEVPDLKTTSILPVGNHLVEHQKTYELTDLVDLGMRSNPVTRNSWEQARSAAAALGIAEAQWLPVISLNSQAGYARYPFPAPGSAFSLKGESITSTVSMTWSLFDKTRSPKIDVATQQLFAANFSLNRTHQKVLWDIQRSFYGLLAAESRLEASEITLHQSVQNANSIESKFHKGLATQPEALLAIQDQAKAGYELQGARGSVMEKQAELAESLGITPNVQLRTVTMNDLPLPKGLEESADSIIDQALTDRPDLAAKLADLRVKEAEIRKAEATYWPTIGFSGDAGWKQWSYQNATGSAGQTVNIGSPSTDAFITMNWNLFEGFAGTNGIAQAEANRNAAQAEFDALQLKVIRDVWKAYAEFKIAVRKREFAVAMLKAAERSYDAAKDTYAQGVATVIELLTAEKNLANARYTEIDSKAGLLQSAAALVYAAGGSADHSALASSGPQSVSNPKLSPFGLP